MSQDKMDYFINLIDDFLDGKLNKEKEMEIRQAIKEDPLLQKVVKQQVQARANIRVAGEAELRTKFANSFDPIAVQTKSKPRLIKVLLPILFLFGLAILAYYFYTKSTPPIKRLPPIASVEAGENLTILATVEDPSYDLLRSEKDSEIAENWQNAVQAFIAKKYETSLTILLPLSNDSLFIADHFGKYTLMKGVANLKLERFAKAKENLIAISPENPYYDQAIWYLALSDYYAGNSAEAKTQLEAIVNNKTHYKKRLAQKYLVTIKK